MAGKPINIEFVADVARFIREVKKVEVSTEDIADALVATSNSAEDLERKLSRAMRDSERDVERLEQAVKDIPKATDKAADQAVRDFDRVGDEIGEVGREAGDEFQSNLGEALSSGSLEDVATDTIGGLVGSLKGATGLFVAAGAGIALAIYNAFREEAARQRQNLEDELGFYDALTGEMDRVAEVTAAVTDFGKGSEVTGWQKVNEYAKTLGLTVEEVVSLLKGDMTAANQANLDLLKDQQEVQGLIRVETGNESSSRQELIRRAEEALEVEQQALDAQKTRNQALREEIEAAGELESHWQNTHNWAQATVDAVRNMPTDVKVQLDFYASGPGAAYINPNSSSYSPGHVAIGNMYVNQAKRGS